MLMLVGDPGRRRASRSGRSRPPARWRLRAGLAAIWVEPYRRARFFSFLDPWGDAQGTGFQTVQAMIGLGSGGIFGTGLGEGVQKINYLPEAHTDMIFAIIGEELGLIGDDARDRRLRRVRVRRASRSRCAATIRSGSGSRRA